MARPDFSLAGPDIIAYEAVGTICHERPNLSFSQPHCCARSSPPSHSLSQQRSTSAWVLHLTTKEIASVNLKCGPPLSAVNSWPSRRKLTVIADPSGRP